MARATETRFPGAVRLVVDLGLWVCAVAVAAIFLLFGPALIDIMTASADVRAARAHYLPFVVVAPLLGVFAFAFDGVYIGATWARDMRNLMVLSLAIFLSAWFALRGFGNAGLWGALLIHYAARGGLEALRYPSLLKASFREEVVEAASHARSRRSVMLLAEPDATRVLGPDHSARACDVRSIRASSYTGQSSAVIVAASAPTISDSESRPVRSKVEDRSLLMSLDQAEALVDQRRIKLDQAGAGADLGQRGAAGVDAADADQRKRALGAHIGLRHHPRRQAETAAGPTSRPARWRGLSRARSKAAPAWCWRRSCRRPCASARSARHRRVRRGSDPARS